MLQPKKKPATQCEKYGHTWISTTADTYRKCSRTGCIHTQHLVTGKWEIVPVLNQNSSSLEPSEQVSLWG